MKYLPLLFLLLSFGVKGQDTRFRKDATGTTVHGIELKSLEEKLLMYASECWNDSTLKEFHEYIPPAKYRGYENPGDSRSVMAGSEVTYKKWIHRKPTFEGFVEYLKKK